MANVTTVHHVTDAFLKVVSIAVNIFLLYLIKKHSTYKVRVYQWMLAVDASLDIALASLTLLIQPVSRLCKAP